MVCRSNHPANDLPQSFRKLHNMSAHQAKVVLDEAPLMYLLHRAIPLLALLLLLLTPCTLVFSEQSSNKPLIVPIAQDPSTSLYTISIEDGGAPLVVDLAGSLVWSTCPSTHSTVPCQSDTCRVANNQHRLRRCRYVDTGPFWATREPASRGGCACAAHPFNPVTCECTTSDLTTFAMSGNTTDGMVKLQPESFAAVGSCAPDRLTESLPAGATGVAGFSRQPLSLSSQLAAQRKFGNKFALCMPGFAAFGNTSIYLGQYEYGLVDYTRRGVIEYTPLLANPRNPGAHYIPVQGVSVQWNGVDVSASVPSGAFDIDARTGRGGVVLSTVTPYTIMRPDVFRPLAQAFDEAITRGKWTAVERVPAVKPFKLCYNGAFAMLKRPVSYDVPWIKMKLVGAGTRNWTSWTVFNNNYLVYVDGATCVGILEMEPSSMPVGGEPAMVIGAKMIRNNLLVFDLEKSMLGFSSLLDFRLSSCFTSRLV